MARLYTSGFETNSTTAGHEWDTLTNVTIDATTKRTGSYAMRMNAPGGAAGARFQWSGSNGTAPFYERVYVYIVAAPASSTTVRLLQFVSASGSLKAGIRLTTGRVVQLWNEEDGTQIGSDGPTLSTSTWYRVEMYGDFTTISSTTLTARIDGTDFASGSANFTSGVCRFSFGASGADASIDIYFDDAALNDSTGTANTSWCGAGNVISMRPDAAGANAAFTSSSGGANYTNVDENPPTDATDFNVDNILDEIDDHAITTPASIATGDTITVVQLSLRFARSGTNPATFVARLRDGAGNVDEGSGVVPAASYATNGPVATLPLITSIDMPGASSTAWTKAELDTAQIGYRISVGAATNGPRQTNAWLTVDYVTPSATALRDIITCNGLIPFLR